MLEEMIAQQHQKLWQVAKRIEPGVTLDDLWQPNDFPELENHPEFRYEEGIWHGMMMVQAAFNSQQQ